MVGGGATVSTGGASVVGGGGGGGGPAARAMSWANGVLRLLRRRAVLGIIFCGSLLYCVVTVIRDHNDVAGMQQFGSDQDSMNGAAAPLPIRSFLWNSNSSAAGGNTNDPGHHQEEQQNRNALPPCKNTMQGPIWVADDRGFICNRTLLLSNGCCDDRNGLLERYPCWGCASGCCRSYELCVACCLRPQQRPLLERVLGRLGRSPKSLQLFALVRTHFDLCLAKCRTSSRSVRNENTYIDPENKHCFGDEEVLADPSKKTAPAPAGG